MHISEWNNQQVKYKQEGALGQVKYVSHPVINQWTEDVVGERWEAEYTEEQLKKIWGGNFFRVMNTCRAAAH